MKILVFIHSLGAGGAERVAVNLANYWAALEHQVTIVTLAPREADRYGLSAGVERIALGQSGAAAGALDGALANGRRVAALRRTLIRCRPDVALSMMTNSNVLLALAALGLKGLRTFGSERVHPPFVPVGVAWEFLRAKCYGLLDGVVAQTEKSGEWVRRNTNARSVTVIPNPVVWPLQKRPPIVALDGVGTRGDRLMLAVGRLEYQKGFDILLDAFAALADRFPNWDLVIIGQGKEHAALQSRISSLALDARAFLIGDVGNVGDWYESADLFAFPSRFEGFPNALAEAMAYGVPPVSFDCDTGPRDLITNGQNGLLVPVGDAAMLTRALTQLMSDANARERLGEEAKAVRDRFALPNIADRWLRLFGEARS